MTMDPIETLGRTAEALAEVRAAHDAWADAFRGFDWRTATKVQEVELADARDRLEVALIACDALLLDPLIEAALRFRKEGQR